MKINADADILGGSGIGLGVVRKDDRESFYSLLQFNQAKSGSLELLKPKPFSGVSN